MRINLFLAFAVVLLFAVYQQYSLLATASPWHQLQQYSDLAHFPLDDPGRIVNVSMRSPKMFHCDKFGGFPEYSFLLSSIFPEYEWHDLERDIKEEIQRISKRTRRKIKVIHYHPESDSHDIFVNHWDNLCSPMAYRFIWQFFQGKVIFVYPEAHNTTRPVYRKDFYELGPLDQRENHIVITYMQACFWMYLSDDEKNKIYGSLPRPRGTGQHFLIYAHSNCVVFREDAFTALSNIDHAHYGGVCDGSKGTKYGQYPNATFASNNVQLERFHENAIFFSNYRFCLVLEHEYSPGYITEKILNAFLAGCLPIYYGTKEIFNFFNRDAFIFYDPNNPQPTIDVVQKLNSDDKLYNAMLSEPILADGERTVELYFSFDGYLKNRVRKMLGLDRIQFVS
jgi:hypothetical protein